MTAYVFSFSGAGIQFSYSFMIRNKIYPVSYPHRACKITVYFFQEFFKFPFALSVYPEFTGCSSFISLPSCGIKSISSKKYFILRTERNIISNPVRQFHRQSPVNRNFIQLHPADKRLTGI